MTTYATWNPSDKSASITLSNGNLTAAASAGGSVRATIGKTGGKWYWENTIDALPVEGYIGIGNLSAWLSQMVGGDANGWSYICTQARKYHSSSVWVGVFVAAGDILSIALDMDNGYIWWGKNGTWMAGGNPATGANPMFSGTSGTIYPMVSMANAGVQVTSNFGASAFSYSAPSGFNSGFYDASEQTEMEDASLDLAAYYRGQSDLQTLLRAHDGIEYRDLSAQLATFNLSVEDFTAFLSAYHQHMDDASLDLITWGERQSDLKSFLAAISQQISSFPLHLWASRETMHNLALYLAATGGITLRDLGCYLSATDGVVARDLGLYLRVVSQAPLFKTMTAQRISSVVSEVV